MRRPRIILACESNGFGPVSKLTAIAGLLRGSQRIFIGDGVAQDFARRSANSFEEFLTTDAFAANPEFAGNCDLAMVVMEPDVAFQILQEGVPVYFFDSLLDFWILPNGIAPLATAAADIRCSPPPAAKRIFGSFSIHERKMLAHILVEGSFAQNFPGVPERIAELRVHGWEGTALLGSMIDVEAPDASAAPQPVDHDGWSMLINLGGVRNFAIDFYKNDYIVDLMERWASRFLADNPDCREILLCCGRYDGPPVSCIGRGRMIRQFVAHPDFIALLKRADVVLSAPGRTFLHEALHLGKVPLLLPEQHSNQYRNHLALADTELAALSLPLGALFDMRDVPASDEAGTEAIIAFTRELVESDSLFDRFDRLLRERVHRLRALDRTACNRLLEEVQPRLSGANFVDTIRDLLGLHTNRS